MTTAGTTNLYHWEPLSVDEAASIFTGASFPWWIAGGWAIDLFLGHQTRPHADTDVLILRRDQLAARATLAGWDVHAADPPGSLRPWALGEVLPLAVHDVWCRRTPDAPWSLQLMLNDTDDPDPNTATTGTHWLFRRDHRIRGPLTDLGVLSPTGIPYLAPEVQLLYKARGQRPKDLADLESTLPLLPPHRIQWLHHSLTLHHPNHPWLPRLHAQTSGEAHPAP